MKSTCRNMRVPAVFHLYILITKWLIFIPLTIRRNMCRKVCMYIDVRVKGQKALPSGFKGQKHISYFFCFRFLCRKITSLLMFKGQGYNLTKDVYRNYQMLCACSTTLQIEQSDCFASWVQPVKCFCALTLVQSGIWGCEFCQSVFFLAEKSATQGISISGRYENKNPLQTEERIW